MDRQDAIEGAIKRRIGDEAAAKKLEAFNEAQDDWWGVCPKCGVRVKGRVAQLRTHLCDG